MSRADAFSGNFRKPSQQLVALRTLEIQRERAAARLLAEESRQIKMSTEKMKAAEAEARLTAEREGISIERRHSNNCRVKDFATVKARRDALRKAEQQSVEGSYLSKIFRDDADQFLLEVKMWMEACELKLLELSGRTIGPDARFPMEVWELFYSGVPIFDENLKEAGRETIIEWCYGNYLCEDDDPRYGRPLLVTQIEYDRVVEAFKTLFERLHPVSASNNLARA